MDEFFSKYESHLLEMREQDEDVVLIKGKLFVVRPATIEDIERIGKGGAEMRIICRLFGHKFNKKGRRGTRIYANCLRCGKRNF